MKKVAAIASVLIVISSLPLFAGPKIRVAVLPISPAGLDSSIADQVTDQVQSVFRNYFTSYEIIERANIDKVLREQALELTGATEEGAQIGKLLNADQVVTGRVGKMGKRYTISLNLVEVATGKVLRQSSPRSESCSLENLNDVLVTPAAKEVANPGVSTAENLIKAFVNRNQPPPPKNYILSVKGCVNLVEPQARIVGQANSWIRVSLGTIVKGRTETVKNTNSPVYSNGQFNLDNYLNGIISLDVYDDYIFSGSQYVGRATITSPVSGTYQILKNGYSWGLVSVEFTPRSEE